MTGVFASVWRQTDEYLQALKLAALMLLVPIDTSECERIFSIMNDVKNGIRSSLASDVLRNLMLWYYYGKDIKTEQLPAYEILTEWYDLCAEEGLAHVRTQRVAGGKGGSGGGGGGGRGASGGVSGAPV
jgi:uncharacterized membrane protein YgcG